MSKTIALVGDIYRVLATGKETGGSYAFFENFVYPDGGPPPHIHTREEEGFYILEGEVTFYVEDQILVGRPGDSFHVKRGTLHRFKNESGKPAKMLVWVAPAGLEEMFLRIGKPVEDVTIAPGVDPTEIDRLLELAPEYGLEIRT